MKYTKKHKKPRNNKKTIRKSIVKPPSLQGGVRVNYYNSQELPSL